MGTSALQGEKGAEEQSINDVLDYRELDVIAALPLSRFYPEGGEGLFRAMVGCRIIRIGSTDEDGIEGGGLIIDYVPPNSDRTLRAVFGFTELGMWIEWDGEISIPA